MSTVYKSLSSACLQEKVERRPGAESQYGFDNIYASWRDAPPVQDWYQGREDGSAATPAADIARPSEELQNAAVASIGVRTGQDKDANEPLSFDELLRIDTKTLTRKEKLDMEAHLSSSEKLALRKARISLQMKGRRPWNTGRSHPEETKRRISQATRKAMERPEVIQKLQNNHEPKLHTQATKDKIRQSLAARYAIEKQVIQDLIQEAPLLPAADSLQAALQNGAFRLTSLDAFAKLMPPSSLAKHQLGETATAKLLLEHFPAKRLQRIIRSAEKVLARTELESSSDEEVLLTDGRTESVITSPSDTIPSLERTAGEGEELKEDHRRRAKEEAHRQAIADAIRKKWEDPEYRLRMLASRAGKKKERKEKRRVTLKKATPEANEGEAQKDEPKVRPRGRPRKNVASPAEPKRKVGRPRKSTAAEPVARPRKTTAEPVSNALLEQLKQQEQALVRKQMQRLAKLNVAKELVLELEAVLASLPSEDELKPGDVDMRQSIIEAQELLAQARSRVRALEQPFMMDVVPDAQSGASEEMLQSAMMMLNMDSLQE